MNAIVLRMPDDPAELAPWLDRQLVGPDLADLVAELEVIHGETPDLTGRSLDEALGDHLPVVLHGGLSALPRPVLRTLLRRPRLLLELQDRVLLDGGLRWDDLARETPRPAEEVESTWRGIAARLGFAVEPTREERSTVLPITSAARRLGLRDHLLRVWVSVATLAASVLAILYAVDRPKPWGWDRPGVLAPARTREAKLLALASAAKEWFNAPTPTPDSLARRLGELRTSCTRLIVADHRDLPPADRAWLVEHCRNWARDFDKAIHDLEEGTPVERVRADVDATVNRLIKAFRGRAASPS